MRVFKSNLCSPFIKNSLNNTSKLKSEIKVHKNDFKMIFCKLIITVLHNQRKTKKNAKKRFLEIGSKKIEKNTLLHIVSRT
jgi:hypothetical protein